MMDWGGRERETEKNRNTWGRRRVKVADQKKGRVGGRVEKS